MGRDTKMSNLTDAWGTVTIEKVGAEFIEFIKEVQSKDDVYYTLVRNENIEEIEPNKNGDLNFEFSAEGRWAYNNNLEGYLKGEWLKDAAEQEKAYDKFMQAIKDKNGSVTITYKDSDTAMNWMGNGEFTVEGIDGEISFNEDWDEEEITVRGFAKFSDETEDWALDYIYGDEIGDMYRDYVEEWKKTHDFVEGREEPASPDEWYNNEYKEEA